MSFGVLGLQLSTLAFLALSLVGLLLAAERIDRRIGPWVTPLAGLLLIPRLTERPHVATWAVLTWVLYFCVPTAEQRALRGAARDAATWRRRLWCLPIIALGSNLHSGAAFASIALGISCVEAFFLGARRWREVALAFSGGAALMANPGGLFNVAYVIKHLHVQDVIVLEEFLPPNFTRERPFFMLVPLALLGAWRMRREWPALLGLVAAFAWLGFRANRVVYEFQLIACLAIVPTLVWIRERWNSRAETGVVVAAVLSLVAFQMSWFATLHFGTRFDRGALPVRAADFIRAEKLDGKVFNGFTDGGYLEWALPELQWFQDARVQAWDPSFFAREQEAEQSPEAFRAWLGEWGVEWAIVSHRLTKMSGRGKLEVPEWAIIYWDETSEIYVRRDVPRFAPLLARLEYRRFKPYGSLVGNLPTATRAELMQWLGEIERFQQSAPRFPEAWSVRCGLLRRLGREQQGEVCAKAAQFASTDRQKQFLALMESQKLASE